MSLLNGVARPMGTGHTIVNVDCPYLRRLKYELAIKNGEFDSAGIPIIKEEEGYHFSQGGERYRVLGLTGCDLHPL